MSQRQCSVCLESSALSSFWTPTSKCHHSSDICVDCTRHFIEAELERNGPTSQIRCPHLGCGEVLAHGDIQKLLPSHSFGQYDTRAAKRAMESIKGFTWCSNPRCENGQVCDGTIMVCSECNAETCAECKVPWHTGMTCEEYHTSMQENDKASASWIKKHTKPCPGCEAPVQKNRGCPHMQCTRCQQQYCWECLGPYLRCWCRNRGATPATPGSRSMSRSSAELRQACRRGDAREAELRVGMETHAESHLELLAKLRQPQAQAPTSTLTPTPHLSLSSPKVAPPPAQGWRRRPTSWAAEPTTVRTPTPR